MPVLVEAENTRAFLRGLRFGHKGSCSFSDSLPGTEDVRPKRKEGKLSINNPGCLILRMLNKVRCQRRENMRTRTE